MRIRNSAASSGTTQLHDSECMEDGYVAVFDEGDGTVANVTEEVGEALVEKYDAIEPADDPNGSDNDE